MRGNNAECSTCCVPCLGPGCRESKENRLENRAVHMLNRRDVIANPSAVGWHSLLDPRKEGEEDL